MNTLDLVRGLVRPIVTLALVLTVSFMVLQALSVPDWYQQMVGMVIAFWFGQRTVGTPNGTK